jgi:hypothetical protein
MQEEQHKVLDGSDAATHCARGVDGGGVAGC